MQIVISINYYTYAHWLLWRVTVSIHRKFVHLILLSCLIVPVLAAASGEVNLYSARKEKLIKPLLDRFTTETGITVNLVTGKADALLQGRSVSRLGSILAPEKRRVGMVFQDFALYPHLTVARNVAFGLSGLSARQQRARQVRTILKREGVTALLVTHDQLEAFALADEIGVLGGGRLRQWDSGYHLYHTPRDRFVADFIGQGAILRGRVTENGYVDSAIGCLRGLFMEEVNPGQTVELLLRPHDVIHDDASSVRLEVVDKVFQGAEFLYTLRLGDGSEILCLVQSHHDHATGQKIGVRLQVEHPVAFPL
jgi:ABC-type Fe3+/spermidine/putrescine transport system ATPase subunit